MGLYHHMQDMGLIASYRLHKGKRIDWNGAEVDCLLVDIECGEDTVTLHSEAEYSEDPSRLGFALDSTFLHSVKLGSKKPAPQLQRSSIFSSGASTAPTLEPEAIEEDNLVFTEEGIYHFKEKLEEDTTRRRMVRDIGRGSLYRDMSDEDRAELENLGGVKIIGFVDKRDPESKLSIYNKLLAKGAKEVYPLTFHQDRAKAIGHMYEAKAVLELEGFTYNFEMWHHHQSEEHMTEEEVKNAIQLKDIKVGGKAIRKLLPDATTRDEPSYYKLYNNAVVYKNIIFFTPYKFVENSIVGKQVAEIKHKIRIEGLTEEIVSELEALDFRKII